MPGGHEWVAPGRFVEREVMAKGYGILLRGTTAYHASVQYVVVLMIVGLAAIGATVGARAILSRKGQVTRLQVALGIAAGLVAAFAALVVQVDLLPDGPDDALEGIFVVGMTMVAVIVSWYRIARV